MSRRDLATVVPRRHAGVGVALFTLLFVLLIAGWIIFPNTFFPAYWFAVMSWTQLSVGCLVLLLIRLLTGGDWADAVAPLLRRGASGLLIMLPLFIPVFFALPHIYSWTNIQPGVSSKALVLKQPWLNPVAFDLRACVYLAILVAILRYWRRPGWTVETPGAGWSGPSLVFVVLVFSFASSDWMMSIEPTFYSSLYPFMYFSSAMLGTMAAVCGAVSWLQLRGSWPREPEITYALGQLFLASVIFWGYILFSQFIIIWTGNLPDEADWYVVRTNHGWQWWTLFVVLSNFAIPFGALLSQSLKRDPRRLLRVSCAVFAVHFADIYWLMAPKKGIPCYLNLFDIILPALIGACWLWFVAGISEATSARELTREVTA